METTDKFVALCLTLKLLNNGYYKNKLFTFYSTSALFTATMPTTQFAFIHHLCMLQTNGTDSSLTSGIGVYKRDTTVGCAPTFSDDVEIRINKEKLTSKHCNQN